MFLNCLFPSNLNYKHIFLDIYINDINQATTTNFNFTSNPTMLQSVGIELDEGFREVTTDNTRKEIELLISPLLIVNNTKNSSETSTNEVLNHHWTFYISVRNIT